MATLISYMDQTISYEVSLATLPTVLQAIPRTTLDTITGNLLGDGSIGYSNLSRDGAAQGNARYGMRLLRFLIISLIYIILHMLNTLAPDYDHILILIYHNMQVRQSHNMHLTRKLILSLLLYIVCDIDEILILSDL
jgi:hypothetical protein